MKESGKMEKEMVMEFYVGVMNQNLWENLKMIKWLDMENYGMIMEIFIKVIGKNFKLREQEYIKQKKEHILKENGKMIDKMVLGWKIGQKEVIFLGNIMMEIKMELEC